MNAVGYLAASDDGGTAGLGLVLLVILIAAYFVPTIVAAVRNHHQAGAIAVINFFLGWTFIGWVVALAMACGQVRASAPPR